MTDILAQLNPAQHAAVTAPDGPLLVVAGAGSGKTRVLTTRIAWLLQTTDLFPGSLLAFTFTNRAAREMRERVDQFVGGGRAPHWIGTFHATGVRILRRDGERLGILPGFTIYDTDDTIRLLKQVMQQHSVDPKQIAPRSARNIISNWKNSDTPPETARSEAHGYVEEQIALVFAGYEKALRQSNALDFDDLILRTVHLLENHDDIREKYARQFQHVLVDEFQDTNPLQLVLVKALSSYHGNVFVVGDDDQSIYSWRGACIENMLNFEEYFPGAQLLRLEQNYRSTGNILAAANAVIAHNRRRKGKNLWTEGETGDQLRIEGVGDAEDEAARVVGIVVKEIAGGLTRQDLTILYRTNAQSRVIEDALRRANVPYQVVGSLQFYERREVRDLLAYLKLVANPSDQVSALRILNVPRRKIGATTVTRLSALAQQAELSLPDIAWRQDLLSQELAPAACRRVRDFFSQVESWRQAAVTSRVPDLLERIITETGYATFLESDDPTTAKARIENVAELINAAAAFDEGSDGGSLAMFLEQVALVSDADALAGDQGNVRLMTIHTAKGLEFPVVLLVGCEEDLLPHISSQELESDREEERRLFYVALTRACRRVYLLHAQRRRRFGIYEDTVPSRYLNEIPEALTQRQEVEVGLGRRRDGYGPGPATGRPTLGAPSRSAREHGPVQRNSQREPATSLWEADVSQVEVQFCPGQTVRHASYGRGVVTRVEGSGDNLKVTVDFDSAGSKHLLARFAHLFPCK
ncbi:MAG: UvrD-helicase domain-containing protein [bacterium]